MVRGFSVSPASFPFFLRLATLAPRPAARRDERGGNVTTGDQTRDKRLGPGPSGDLGCLILAVGVVITVVNATSEILEAQRDGDTTGSAGRLSPGKSPACSSSWRWRRASAWRYGAGRRGGEDWLAHPGPSAPP